MISTRMTNLFRSCGNDFGGHEVLRLDPGSVAGPVLRLY